jgi:hypothetical protein
MSNHSWASLRWHHVQALSMKSDPLADIIRFMNMVEGSTVVQEAHVGARLCCAPGHLCRLLSSAAQLGSYTCEIHIWWGFCQKKPKHSRVWAFLLLHLCDICLPYMESQAGGRACQCLDQALLLLRQDLLCLVATKQGKQKSLKHISVAFDA